MITLAPLHILTLQSLPNKTTLKVIIDNLNCTSLTSLDDLYQEITSFMDLKKSEFQTASQRAEQILEESEKANIKIITISDSKFPRPLSKIKNPPLVLYIKGEIKCLRSERLIAIIGTRTPSEKGKKAGIKISKKFTESGWNIVSGLALGCDTAAHEGCLEAKGQTIAFLAHGLHKIYPAENSNLAQRIIDSSGCLVSEYPLRHEDFKHQFIERDRLQSGLSSGVIVIETEVEGGTMHTVNFCLEQKKPLACLNYAGDYSCKSRYGNKKLINEGIAFPLWEPETIENFEKLVMKTAI